jgi:NADH dehydrogenase FAD-containing subunit
LLLIGGGHAHVAVLADRIRRGASERATLLTPFPTLRYSGMVPGWIAGEHGISDGLVDLAGLAARADCDLVLDRCVSMDPEGRIATTQAGQTIAFDIASIDSGGVGRAASMLGHDPRLLDIRPIDTFVDRLETLQSTGFSPQHIAIVGGGAGGVELAFALRNAQWWDRADVTLVAGQQGLLPGFAEPVAARVRAELTAQGIALIAQNARFEAGALHAGTEKLEPVDLIVAALGSAAPDWPGASGLACDTAGFIAVDAFQRSLSHPHIFAVGDVAARSDRAVAHSGVHAVHAGPVLAANLRAALDWQSPPDSYTPRRASLYLISTGNGGAIASYGGLATSGRWVGQLKRWIDRRWIGKYAALARDV